MDTSRIQQSCILLYVLFKTALKHIWTKNIWAWVIYLGTVGMGHEDQNPETKCGTNAIKAKFGSNYLMSQRHVET